MPDLVYQTLEVYTRRARRGGLPVPPGPAVRALAPTTTPLTGSSVEPQLRQELGVLANRIRAMMPMPRGGVLLGIVLHEARELDAKGDRPQALVSLEILGVGRVPDLAVSVYGPGLRRTRRAPRGWCSRMLFLWATT